MTARAKIANPAHAFDAIDGLCSTSFLAGAADY